MAELPPKDKPEPDEAELSRQLIEALASAYFRTCRRLAKLLNRRSR